MVMLDTLYKSFVTAGMELFLWGLRGTGQLYVKVYELVAFEHICLFTVP